MLLNPGEPDDHKQSNPKNGFDYYPECSHLTFEQQVALKQKSLLLKDLSREELYCIALDAFCLAAYTRNVVTEIFKKP